MGNDGYGRGYDPQGGYDGRYDRQDYGRGDGDPGRSYGQSGLRGYGARGGDDDDRRQGYGGRDYGSRDYGPRDYGHEGYGRREQFDRDQGRGGSDRYQGQRGWSQGQDDQRGGYGGYRPGGDRDRQGQRGYGAQPQGYHYEDRGFLARAGDEVRSWFGDEEAEQRRDADSRYDERAYADQDHDYRSWRRGQTDAFDRDYHEYRTENRQKFQSEFATWRTARQGQRDALLQVKEHMDVVGSDGQHVGTVDKVRGDRIILTKSDVDAGGRHHSIPSRWIDKVDTGVTLSKTADEAKQAWRDEENREAAASSYGDRGDQGRDADRRPGGNLNRSFPGTY